MAEIARSMESETVLQYLLNTRLDPERHISRLRTIVTVQLSEHIPEVLRKLSQHGVLSAPVLQGATYFTMISIQDIVMFITRIFWGSEGHQWVEFMQNNTTFNNATVATILNSHLWRYPRPDALRVENSVMHAMEYLTLFRGHRTAIVDSRQHVVGIITESMLLHEVRQRLYKLGPLRYTSVLQLLRDSNMDHQKLCVIKESERAINGFNILSLDNISGMPVVDSDGVLTGQLSARDMRGIGSSGENFSRLFNSVGEFLSLKEADDAKQGNVFAQRKPPSILQLCVSPDHSFNDVVERMDDWAAHRVFVCSDDSIRARRPICEHVLSQSDMLRALLIHMGVPAPAPVPQSMQC